MRLKFEQYHSIISNGFNIIDEIRSEKYDTLKKNDIIIVLANSLGKRSPVRAPYDCYVKNIDVEIGQIVNSNDFMINIDTAEYSTNSDTLEAEIIKEGSDNSKTTDVLSNIAKLAALGAGIYFGGKFLSKRKDNRSQDKRLKKEHKRNKEIRKEEDKRNSEIRKEEHKKNSEIVKQYKKAKQAEANAEKYASQERYKQNNKCVRCGGRGEIKYQGGGSDSCRQCSGTGVINKYL